MADKNCTLCDGMGMRIVRYEKGKTEAKPCECHIPSRNAELLRRSQVPERYKLCTLESYRYDYENADPSLYRAFRRALDFTQDYVLQPKGQGLLFTGQIGTGKTHLAVAILQELAGKQGIRTLFCDQGELLRDVSRSFHRDASITEMEVLTPILEAELLVLDELGRFKKSEWVSDIVAHVLNVRYNDRRTTIITTNYPNRPPLSARADVDTSNDVATRSRSMTGRTDKSIHDLEPVDLLNRRLATLSMGKSIALSPAHFPELRNRFQVSEGEGSAGSSLKKEGVPAKRSSRVHTEETLGDRIGERVRSRLAEMCVTVEMVGADYRDGPRKAYLY